MAKLSRQELQARIDELENSYSSSEDELIQNAINEVETQHDKGLIANTWSTLVYVAVALASISKLTAVFSIKATKSTLD